MGRWKGSPYHEESPKRGRPFSWRSPPKAGRGVEVHLVAYTMTMNLMGIKQEEVIERIGLRGVATCLDHAHSGNVNLFT
jgi:hypothetical protein